MIKTSISLNLLLAHHVKIYYNIVIAGIYYTLSKSLGYEITRIKAVGR